jgi:hypothetical protein
MCDSKIDKIIHIHGWPRAMTVDLAARYIGLAPKTLRNRICRHSDNPFPVKSVKHGGKRIFYKEDLDAYLDELKKECEL